MQPTEPVQIPADLVGTVLFTAELTRELMRYMVALRVMPIEEAEEVFDRLRLRFETARNDPAHRLASGYDRAMALLDDLGDRVRRSAPDDPPET